MSETFIETLRSLDAVAAQQIDPLLNDPVYDRLDADRKRILRSHLRHALLIGFMFGKEQ